jgi:hypothetical protein
MRYVLALLLGFTIMGFGQRVFGADLPIPRVRPATPLPKTFTPNVSIPPERCLKTGENPSAGQTLHVDKSCPSGLRWIFAR